MADKTVMVFNSDGEGNGLETWDPIPSGSVASGDPVQTGYEYLNIDNGALTAGVWTCTPWVSTLEPYSVNEFMIVLEGTITIEHENGNVQSFGPGQCFAIPKGTPCIWKQTDDVRKYYFIFDHYSSPMPKTAEGLDAIGVVVPNILPAIDPGDPALFIGDPPVMGLQSVMVDPSGQFEVGVWESSPMIRQPAVLGRTEIMHILEGSGSITNGDGLVTNFSAGDTLLVPVGMGYQWQSSEYVKKIFCSLTPQQS